MAEVKLLRVDFRLIHGLVITKWYAQSRANGILIIDDTLAQDPFMADIYKMSAPEGCQVSIRSVDDAARAWSKNDLGDARLLVLFRDVEQLYRAWKLGFPIPDVQIGGLGSAPGRTVVFGPIMLDDADASMLKHMAAMKASTSISIRFLKRERWTFPKCLRKTTSRWSSSLREEGVQWTLHWHVSAEFCITLGKVKLVIN